MRRVFYISQFILEKIGESSFLIFTGVPKVKLTAEIAVNTVNEIIIEFGLKGAQIFDNRYIWGQKHISSAVWHAWNAFLNNRMISKSLSMEILLYAAGFRQIKKAIELLGVRDSTKVIVGVLIADNESQSIDSYIRIQKQIHLDPNINLLTDYSSKQQYIIEMLTNEGFLLSEATISKIENAILQRIAILALE